MDYNKVNY